MNKQSSAHSIFVRLFLSALLKLHILFVYDHDTYLQYPEIPESDASVYNILYISYILAHLLVYKHYLPVLITYPEYCYIHICKKDDAV